MVWAALNWPYQRLISLPTKSGRKVKAKRAETEIETATQKPKTDREKEFSFFSKKSNDYDCNDQWVFPRNGSGQLLCYAPD